MFLIKFVPVKSYLLLTKKNNIKSDDATIPSMSLLKHNRASPTHSKILHNHMCHKFNATTPQNNQLLTVIFALKCH